MSLSTAEKIYLCVALTDFGGIFVWLGVALHLAYTKMDMMLGYFRNSPAVMNRLIFNNGGPWGKLFVLGGIVSVMLTPRIYLRDGGASAEDLESFPADLKRKLMVLHWVGWVLILVMCGLAAVVKLGLV